MTCERCGSRTTTGGSLCRSCQRDQRRDDHAPSTLEAFECPDCGGSTSGRGVSCYKCRQDADDAQETEQEIATDGGVPTDDAGIVECPSCDALDWNDDGTLSCGNCGYQPRASVRSAVRNAITEGRQP
jgi:hypothetical protein